MHKVYLKPGKEDSLKRFHPWIFSGAIAHFDGEPEEGEVVEVYTSKKEFIAKGHFQIGSIAIRVLSFKQEEIDHDFWKRKLEVAYDMRRSIGIATNPTNNTYRLVHGEGDNLPGLVIDVYARTAVMQAHSAGMHVDRMAIAEALSEVMGKQIENIYYKSETTLPFKADLFPENGFLKGGSNENIAQEYGLKFHVDWLKGQKTGFFVDQRENRALLERYAKDRSVLNTLGFPTVNLQVPPQVIVPAFGVYATRVWVEGRSYIAVTNVGVRPTVEDNDGRVTVEGFILDFDGDLYGKELRMEFYHRIRGEQKFPSLQELSQEIRRNAEETRAYFLAASQDAPGAR